MAKNTDDELKASIVELKKYLGEYECLNEGFFKFCEKYHDWLKDVSSMELLDDIDAAMWPLVDKVLESGNEADMNILMLLRSCWVRIYDMGEERANIDIEVEKVICFLKATIESKDRISIY